MMATTRCVSIRGTSAPQTRKESTRPHEQKKKEKKEKKEKKKEKRREKAARSKPPHDVTQ